MILSTKAKEAIKTALAMTISYGIALSMDWERPYWAGFAVAFISLATVGQSLNKAALRMLGTLLAMVVSLTLIGLFAQDRWLFMFFLSTYVGFCTYMMGGKANQYFWFVCGFVCVIICMSAGPNSINAFEIAILRAQETGLGILVYSVVGILLWPTSTGADFVAVASKLASIQHQLYRVYLGIVTGEENAAEAQILRGQEIQARARFAQLLDAAESDSYEVWEVRRAWRRYQRHVEALAETMERWRGNFAELQALDLGRLVPNLSAFGAELDLRFAQIECMMADQAPEQRPTPLELLLDDTEVRALAHFERAALAVARTPLQRLDVLTRTLFEGLCHIKGFGQTKAVADTDSPSHAGIVLDKDRLTGVVRVMSTLWLVYLAWIYVEGIPGGAGLVSMTGPFAMILATKPQLPVSALFVPIATSVLFGGLIHIFVMPPLSSFTGLGVMIFAVTFAICYLFAAPKQALGRAFGLAMFVTIASISNEQTYSFLGVATTALMFPLLFLALTITAYFPFCLRAERVFLRLLVRFFRSCEHLISTMHGDFTRNPSRVDRWKMNFHVFEVSSLPRKLGAWAPHINTKAMSATSSEQVQAVVASLQALAFRMQALLETRGHPQAPFLVQELLSDIQAWRLKVQETFQRLSGDPAIVERQTFSAKLAKILGHLEGRIKETLDKAQEGQVSDQGGGNFYRLLGAYRGVSEALVEFAGSAGAIDWAEWREGRF